ncbi:uncharacterized protein LOC108736685 [Agrilus planipennis]|uniref:Uncharacterized protein LOC108736685 n=1 Tax=Agrilus planipennis TaxID=224129 RepID=A0A1W4WLA2_AGRPL|nr:uncharacterized protein LOC108736685 [Agrilus planipennis]
MFTYNIPADCEYANFTMTSDVTGDFFWIRKNLTTGQWSGRSDGVVTWTPASNRREGIISQKYPNVANPLVYLILGVRYDEYVVEYRCVNVNSTTRMEFMWTRGRTKRYTDLTAIRVRQVRINNGLANLRGTFAAQDQYRCSP